MLRSAEDSASMLALAICPAHLCQRLFLFAGPSRICSSSRVSLDTCLLVVYSPVLDLAVSVMILALMSSLGATRVLSGCTHVSVVCPCRQKSLAFQPR